MATAPLLRKLGRAERALNHVSAAHQIDTIRAKVDEIIQALANLNTNVTGSSSGTTVAASTAKWTGSYSTSSANGTKTTALSSDTILKYPPALGTPAKSVTLSDDGTEGALLTADSTFSVNSISLKAPNATNTLRIGKYGNIALAGTSLVDQNLMRFIKTDFDETTTTPTALSATLTNKNIGAGSPGIIAVGIVATINGSCATAAGTTTNTVQGMGVALTAGNASNDNFIGSVIGYRAQSITVIAKTVGTIVPLCCMFESGTTSTPLSVTRAKITDYMGYRARMGASLLISGTITNTTGFKCESVTTGTNRYGMYIDAINGGTIATGVEIVTHSGGTTRRGMRAGNTCEITGGYWQGIASKGLLVPDTQVTPEYWAVYPDSTGTKDMTMTVDALGFASFTRAASATGNVILTLKDTGTAAPTT